MSEEINIILSFSLSGVDNSKDIDDAIDKMNLNIKKNIHKARDGENPPYKTSIEFGYNEEKVNSKAVLTVVHNNSKKYE